MSSTKENVIVITIMIAIVIGLLCFVGYSNIEAWLSTPFTWDENEDITLHLISKETNKMRNEEVLTIVIENATPETLTEYSFTAILEGVEFNVPGFIYHSDIDPYDVRVIEKTISGHLMNSDGCTEEQFEKIRNSNISELQFDYKTEYIEANDKKIINNNGTVKIITILVCSLVLGLLGFVSAFPVWLRIILKVCGLPILLTFIILFFFVKARQEKEEEAKRKRQA